jgi:hypothetical protein
MRTITIVFLLFFSYNSICQNIFGIPQVTDSLAISNFGFQLTSIYSENDTLSGNRIVELNNGELLFDNGFLGVGNTADSIDFWISSDNPVFKITQEQIGKGQFQLQNNQNEVFNIEFGPDALSFKFPENFTVREQSTNDLAHSFQINGDRTFYSDASVEGAKWESSTSRLGIGEPVPSEALDVVGNAEINGNIIVTGTVDGIDIATDVAANTAKTGITAAQSTNISEKNLHIALVPVGTEMTDIAIPKMIIGAEFDGVTFTHARLYCDTENNPTVVISDNGSTINAAFTVNGTQLDITDFLVSEGHYLGFTSGTNTSAGCSMVLEGTK